MIFFLENLDRRPSRGNRRLMRNFRSDRFYKNQRKAVRASGSVVSKEGTYNLPFCRVSWYRNGLLSVLIVTPSAVFWSEGLVLYRICFARPFCAVSWSDRYGFGTVHTVVREWETRDGGSDHESSARRLQTFSGYGFFRVFLAARGRLLGLSPYEMFLLAVYLSLVCGILCVLRVGSLVSV